MNDFTDISGSISAPLKFNGNRPRISSMRLKFVRIFLKPGNCLCLLCLLLISCSQQESPNQQQPSAAAAKLTIGLIPEQDIFAQKKRYEPLLAHLAEQLDIVIEIQILPSYGNIIENFNDLGLDGAFFGSFTGAMAIEKLGVEPLARPQYIDGDSTYYGMVFVRKVSGIGNAGDMQGKRMAFVDKATTAGYLLPLSYFKSIGIRDYRKLFSEYYFSGTHEDAINDVLNGFADIGAAKNTVFYRLAANDSRVSRELEILATSPRVPANGLSVRRDLSSDLKRALQQQLLAMHEHDASRAILKEMKIDRFVKTTAADYQPVLDYAADLGFDLDTYHYLND
jgi:phosphonate transport system substrate-binding protein